MKRSTPHAWMDRFVSWWPRIDAALGWFVLAVGVWITIRVIAALAGVQPL